MKKLWLVLIFLALWSLTTVLGAEDYYLRNSIDIRLNVDGKFNLVSSGGSPRVENVNADLLLYPKEDFRQDIQSLDTQGTVTSQKIAFSWTDGSLGEKKFGYKALIRTHNQQLKVQNKIPFPLRSSQVQGYEQYTQPTETIDSANPNIIAKATQLAEGEDDLFKVTFKLANWVDENVKYDLTSLTAETSQKASWVLEHQEGVCDEMTSLFVAMARSLGIPARFVSGISYTEDEKAVGYLGTNWAPHAWAEVYFPDVGWVSFDIAFGEYGYVDVTHIKLRDGFDPKEPATKYEWVARDVELQASNLDVTATVQNKGQQETESIQVEQEVLAPAVGFGSYNLVKGIAKNNDDNYATATLQLSVPREVQVIGRNKRTILLLPHEVKETSWLVKIGNNLDASYVYTFPTVIYTEKNVTVRDEFTTQMGEQLFSQQEIESLMVKHEDKSYSRKISVQCNYPKEVPVSHQFTLSCTVKNTGNANLHQLEFCLEKVCEIIELPINQEKTTQVQITASEAGHGKAVVSVENKEVEKREVLEYVVSDVPNITIATDHPDQASLDSPIQLAIHLHKTSFADPKEVVILVRGLGVEQKIETPALNSDRDFSVTLDGGKLGRHNDIQIRVLWNDAQSKLYSQEQTIAIAGETQGLGNTFRLWWNSFLGWFW